MYSSGNLPCIQDPTPSIPVMVQASFIVACSHCHLVRDQDGSWRAMSYEEKRLGLPISHSLCERCAKLLYPDLF